jgi:hypothetical protein
MLISILINILNVNIVVAVEIKSGVEGAAFEEGKKRKKGNCCA